MFIKSLFSTGHTGHCVCVYIYIHIYTHTFMFHVFHIFALWAIVWIISSDLTFSLLILFFILSDLFESPPTEF